MDKVDAEIIEGVKFLLSLILSLVAVYKVILDLAKEKTKRIQAEEIEKTRRTEIEFKENSLGAEIVKTLKSQLTLLETEITELQKYKGENNLKIERLQDIVRQIETISKFIQERMLSMFPNSK